MYFFSMLDAVSPITVELDLANNFLMKSQAGSMNEKASQDEKDFSLRESKQIVIAYPVSLRNKPNVV